MGAVCLACCNQVHNHVAFNECFLSLSGEDWVNRCNRGHWRGIPSEWDPCCWDPLSGDRNSLWFCTLVKVNTPLHPPPLSPASIYHSRVTIGSALLPRMGLYSEASQPDVCSSRGFFSLFLILFELLAKGGCHSKRNASPLSSSEDPKSRVWGPPWGL